MSFPKIMSLDHYRGLVRTGLSETHSCPLEIVDALMTDYDDVVRGCWNIGMAAVTPIKLLYAELRTFRVVA